MKDLLNQSGQSTFTDLERACKELRWAFPHLVSYSRFLELKRETLEVLQAYLATRYGSSSGDATRLPVCIIAVSHSIGFC